MREMFLESEKSEGDILREQLFMRKLNGVKGLDPEQIHLADEFCVGYKDFLDKSKTERETANFCIELAKKSGFVEFRRNQSYKPGDKVYYINRGKAVIFAVIGRQSVNEGVRIAVAHTDTPRVDLKPNPLYEASDLALFKTHYYGGIKKYQWTAIPLALHGRVIKVGGQHVDICIGEDPGDPCFCITDLLPHLAKEQMTKPMAKGISADELNLLVGSRPFSGGGSSELVKLNIMRLLNEKYEIIEADFLSAELEIVPALKAVDIGLDRSMVGAYGQDDRVCVYTSFWALLHCPEPEYTVITVLADKEEVGSDGNTGMKSAFFRYFIADLAHTEKVDYRHVLSRSKCLSADVNAAFDPTFSTCYDPLNSCYINNGVVITKYTGSGGKFSTSDASAEYMFEIRNLLDREGILWQTGELGKVDMGGGGTIAKYMAALDVDVVDLGVPVLSMHAPMEVVSKVDVHMAYRAVRAFFE